MVTVGMHCQLPHEPVVDNVVAKRCCKRNVSPIAGAVNVLYPYLDTEDKWTNDTIKTGFIVLLQSHKTFKIPLTVHMLKNYFTYTIKFHIRLKQRSGILYLLG